MIVLEQFEDPAVAKLQLLGVSPSDPGGRGAVLREDRLLEGAEAICQSRSIHTLIVVVVERIPIAGPWITEKEIAYVADACENGWYANHNVYIDRFESAFAEYVGRRFAVSLSNCTAGIHLSLLALGVGPGDEVIVPDVTWIASVAPVVYVGATPVFADIDPVHWCLTPASIAACLTPRTKAVIVVDLYGNVPDWGAIQALCEQRGVHIIEDSAEAIGSQYDGRMAGSFGAASVFSFHGTKTVVTGEGGMLVTDNEEFHQRALVLRDHGRRPGDTSFCNDEVGYKYRMSGLQAALGLAQLERVDDLVDRKREIFSWYKEELGSLHGVAMNPEPPRTKNSYWMSTLVLDPSHGLTKEELMERLEPAGIDMRPFFHPLSAIPAFSGHDQAAAARDRNAVSYAISPYGINLPSALLMTREQAGRVGSALRDILS